MMKHQILRRSTMPTTPAIPPDYTTRRDLAAVHRLVVAKAITAAEAET
jgi:hypothetical protein